MITNVGYQTARRTLLLTFVLLLLSALPASAAQRGPKTPEVDWFTYSVTGSVFRWQTFEEYAVRGFSVEYAPDRIQGLVWEPPVSLWSSGYIVAQAPGTLGGAQYEVSALRVVRMHWPVLCTWYETWWRCDLLPTTVK